MRLIDKSFLRAASKPPPAPVDPGARAEMRGSANWESSSFDLERGLDVSEELDTIPADLFDELFKRRL